MGEDGVREADLADIVQQAADADILLFLRRQTQVPCQPQAVLGNASGMAFGIGIAGPQTMGDGDHGL